MKQHHYLILGIAAIAVLIVLSQTAPQKTLATTFTFVQSTTTSETSGSGTYNIIPSTNLTAGNEMFCVVTLDDGPNDVTSLTDTESNTYTMDFEQDSATPRAVTFWSAPIKTGGTQDTITVHYNSAASNNSSVSCQEWSYGGGGTITKDITKGAAATSNSLSTGASSATTQSSELVFVGSVTTSTNTTCSVGSGYSNISFNAVSNANQCMESATVSSTGAQTGTMTWTTSRAYGIGLVTYYVKSSVAAVGAPIFVIRSPLVIRGSFVIR